MLLKRSHFLYFGSACLGTFCSFQLLLNGHSIHVVEGPSMFPTLNSSRWNDVVLVRKIDNPLKEVPELLPLNSIVCLRHPKKVDRFLVKRLRALEGDFDGISIPKDHCWVSSDGGKGFIDSTMFGPVPIEKIYGNVRMIIFPPHRFGRIASVEKCHGVSG